jgi:hypothetical protein
VSGLNHLGHGPGEDDKVGAPGTLESFAPIWGSGRQAVYDWQNGDFGWATFNGVMAISDILLVKTLATAAGKGAWKLGGHSWKATRKWMLKNGYVSSGEPLHHWAIPQSTAKKYGLEWLANQPWNLKKFTTHSMHMRAGHGMRYLGEPGYNKIGQLWYGTPTWTKSIRFLLR